MIRRLSASAAAVVVLLALAGAGCAGNPASVTVPLKFRPTSQMNMNAFAGDLPEANIQIRPVNDVREQKDRIGENQEDKTPVPVLAGGTEPTHTLHT